MKIQLDYSSLRQTRWHDYAIRFFFGGAITVLTGLISTKFGPSVAGLFLAFPAIFPATATLIEKHEKQKKQKAGFDGAARGRSAASIDARGAAMGSAGLAVFALIAWTCLPAYSSGHGPILVLSGAAVAWFGVSFLMWTLRKKIRAAFARLRHRREITRK